MATFRVGQRVKLVRPCFKENYGNTGTIIKQFPDRPVGFGYLINCDVRWDALRPGYLSFTHTSQLEPIVDDGRQVITWDACVWRPEEQREQPATEKPEHV